MLKKIPISKKALKRILALIIILAVATGGFFTYRHFSSEKVSNLPRNEGKLTEKVFKGEIQESITASGMVYLAEETEVYAEGESNIIKEFLVEEGDSVTQGQLLVNYNVKDKKEELEEKISETKLNLENSNLSLKRITLLLHQGRIEAFDRADQVLKPELLENVYNVEISVERTKNGFLNAIPVRPLEIKK